MRALYLIRHGRPAFPGGVPCCLGRLDLPLSPEGEAQGLALRNYVNQFPFAAVYASPLARCRRTAQLLGRDYEVLDDLTEVDMGLWDGLTFETIRARWPEEYRRRGEDLAGTPVPGGENMARCRDRAMQAVRTALAARPEENLILVAHSGVNRMVCAGLTGQTIESGMALPQPYGSVTQLLLDGAHAYLGAVGTTPEQLPPPIPDEKGCRTLLEQYGTPAHVVDHCRAVAGAALELWAVLDSRGVTLDQTLIFAGAMLHDVARTQPHHALAGARWLAERGYAALGAVVGDHMCLPPEEQGRWSEKSVVFLADKLVQGTRRVTLEERFSRSLTSEKAPYARRRYEQARVLFQLLERGG